MNYKEQIGIITYPAEGAGSNFVQFHVEQERKAGNVIVYRDGHVTIHRK